MFHQLAKRLRRRSLAIALWALFVANAFLMVKASSDPLLPLFAGTAAERRKEEYRDEEFANDARPGGERTKQKPTDL